MTDPRPVLQLAHSPDPDDAFMWWPLFEIDGQPPRLDTGPFRYVPVTQDIESLNERSETGELEITAMSCAQYPAVRATYAMTSCGASMGDDYGPKLVARAPTTVDELRASAARIAVPGMRTSAYGAVSVMLGHGEFSFVPMEFDAIPDAVAEGLVEAGVVIHEGQLTFEEQGLHLVEDLGCWWKRTTGLPMPLGVNTVRRDLEDRHGPGTLATISGTLLESVEYALAHRDESIEYALGFARGIPTETADRFVAMYVNSWTLDFGDTGREAVGRFLADLHQAGVCPDPGPIDFVSPP